MWEIKHLLCQPGKRLILFVLSGIISLSVFAQQTKVIKGRVLSPENKPLPGASVEEKGEKITTSTNDSGFFSINVHVPGKLLVHHVGYKEREIDIAGQQTLNIFLELSSDSLDQVVVVAYGTQKKATITGAISTIQTKEIKQSPSSNLAVTLAGRLPGLITSQTSGEPGRDNVNLYLRGIGTVNGQAPVILVDGVPRTLTYIDPNEVESVSILKDASATAMFGVRGANGVILVTTKRGANVKPEISLSAEHGVQSFTRFPKKLSSYQSATLRNDADANDGLPAQYTAGAVEHYRLQDMPDVYPNNDWYKMNVKSGQEQDRYNLNITGGGQRVRYFVNAGYLQQNGLWKVDQKQWDPSSRLRRYNFRSNVDMNVTDDLSAFLNIGGYLENANGPGTTAGDILANLWRIPSTMPGPLTPDGNVVAMAGSPYEVYGLINRLGYTQNISDNVTASFGMQQKLNFITPGLSAKVMVSFDASAAHALAAIAGFQKWAPVRDVTASGQDTLYFVRSTPDENTPLAVSTSATFASYFNTQAFINYNRTFNKKHAITGLVLFQEDERTAQDDRLPFRSLGVSSRVTYGYDNRYFAEFNAGYNGSEQFAKGKRFGFFPSYSGSWLASNEEFLKYNPVISLLKFRASYGLVGNDQLGGTRFLYLDNISVGPGGYNSLSSLGNGNQINESYIGNPALKWEIAKKQNYGVELGVFKQLQITVDYFNESRDNVLIRRNTVPAYQGLPLSALGPVNIGRIQNKGVEIELTYNKSFSKDLSFQFRINLSHAKNKVLFLDEVRYPATYAYGYRTTGYSIGQNFGLLTDGYFNSQGDIDNSGLSYVGRAPRPGDFKYKDLNKDGVIDQQDQAPIGYSNIPEYTFGASFSVNYKSLDFSILFQGVTHVTGQTTSLFGEGEWDGPEGTYKALHLNAWTADRAAKGEPISFPALSTSQSSSEQQNDFFLHDLSYIRLKNAEIGYTLPEKWSRTITATRIRFYANALNLITWDRVPGHDLDPEVMAQGGSLNYPIQRVVNAGVNINF